MNNKWTHLSRNNIVTHVANQCICLLANSNCILSVNVLILMLLWLTWMGNFLKCCFPQSTVCILYSLQSKAIRMGFIPGTTTFSSQSATLILNTTLLLYVVFLHLNRFLLSSLYVFLTVSSYFFISISPFLPLLCSLLLTLLHVRLLRAFFNK